MFVEGIRFCKVVETFSFVSFIFNLFYSLPFAFHDIIDD